MNVDPQCVEEIKMSQCQTKYSEIQTIKNGKHMAMQAFVKCNSKLTVKLVVSFSSEGVSFFL